MARNHLPDATYAFAPVNKPVLTQTQAQETLIATGGWILAKGEMYDLRAEDIGADACRIVLELRP